jgi:NAD(P)-dependent dehydrogenase (short-subunit alcohol dehydrogenase family)
MIGGPDENGVLHGKVVLVTGAGGGIGKACAVLAAAQGARVIVNDLGVDVSGVGGGAGPAEATAAEIEASGGVAIANSGSVTDRADAEGMVRQAIEAFGGLHAVINPAGFLRDAMFHKMDPADWNAVVDVHLGGAFNICRAAIGHFRDQGEGAFVLFASTSGLIGNVGQSNYGAAKMGVAGLSRILALEGALKGVRSNVVTPFAWTRMIGTIPPTGAAADAAIARIKQSMRPDQVAQLAVALASPATAAVTGQVFVSRGNEITLMSQPRPLAKAVEPNGWTPRSIAQVALPSMADQFYPLKNHMEFFADDPA